MFLCVTESWLSSQIHDPAVAIPDYNLFRKDCTFEAGDGVCVSFLKNLFLVLDWTNVISLTVSLCGFLKNSLFAKINIFNNLVSCLPFDS